MKKLNILAALLFISFSSFAQNETDTVYAKKSDTMRIGNIIIVKKGKKITLDSTATGNAVSESEHKRKSKVSTNWWIVDLGFSNFDDQTNYAAANASGYLVDRPGSDFTKSDFKLRSGKSINVNIWVFMQRLSLVKNNLNLKYGLGLELNNYRFRAPLSFKESGVVPYSGGSQTNSPFIFRDSISFSKNKLAADYITVPLMLNFSTNPGKNKKSFIFSAGVSAGYLYSQRNKQRSNERGKLTNKGDYDLEKFKLSYVAEMGYGPVKLYASYSPKSIFEHSLDIRPYNFGLRFSSW